MKVIKSLVLSSIMLFVLFITSCASNSANNLEESLSEKDMIFIESMKEYKFSMIQAPSSTEFGKQFSKPFIVQINDSKGKCVSELKVTVSYPSNVKEGKIIYKNENLVTDSKGRVSFLPPELNFCVSDKIYFYCTPNKKSQDSSLKDLGIALNFQIKSALFTKGAILVVWEYNEKNKPATNFYTLISVLQGQGISRVGNAPLSDSTTFKLTKSEIYQKNYEIIANEFGFLIGGDVKFTKPYQKNDDGYTVYVTGNFYVLDMKDGTDVYNTSIDVEAKDPNYNKAVSAAKKLVCNIFISEITSKF